MSLLTSTQAKIEAKLFNRLGSTAVRKPYLSQVDDKWGDATTTYSATENITVIPYNFMDDVQTYEKFGDLSKGDTVMAFKYNQSLDIKDIITFDSKTFIIKSIEKFPMSDGNLVKIALISEQIRA